MPVHKKGDPTDGFDVVCSVGFVQWDPKGPETATVAAMKVIAEHVEQMDEPSGVFTFPHPGSGVYCVSVVVTTD